MSDRELTTDEVLALCEEHGRIIRPKTWTAYVTRHQAPEPDRRIGRTPLWRESTILAWLKGDAV